MLEVLLPASTFQSTIVCNCWQASCSPYAAVPVQYPTVTSVPAIICL